MQVNFDITNKPTAAKDDNLVDDTKKEEVKKQPMRNSFSTKTLFTFL